MKNDVLEWLQKWYLSQADGEWEHEHGIKIDTLDNPGWSVTLSLAGTILDSKKFERVEVDKGDVDWYFCWIENNEFQATSSPQHLISVLETFKEWSEAQS